MTATPPADDDSRGQGQWGASDPFLGSYFDGDAPPGLPPGIVVPDDLSALDEEVRAYRKERARLRRQSLLARLFLTRRWYRYGLSGPIVVAVLLVVGLGGALLSFLAPTPGQRPVSRPLEPLAAAPGRMGTVGGLLPASRLSGEEGTVPARSVRPAVLMLLPAQCRCATLVREVAGQVDAAGAGLQPAAVAPTGDPVLAELAANPGSGGERIRPLADVDGALSRTFAPGAVPLLLAVRADGRLARAPLPVHHGDKLAAAIALLVRGR